uniref:Protein of unassigned function n=1 Tax=Parastrongyloides trichosuri TaxID=131310 RepID=A0A0N4ZTX5_PARTI
MFNAGLFLRRPARGGGFSHGPPWAHRRTGPGARSGTARAPPPGTVDPAPDRPSAA